jgi:hypothetical protein
MLAPGPTRAISVPSGSVSATMPSATANRPGNGSPSRTSTVSGDRLSG